VKTLICLVGLPRSGKTTWALERHRTTRAAIVCPDAIRLALHGQDFVAEAEPFVWAIARTMVQALFLAGHQEIILDATNVSLERRKQWIDKRWTTLFHVIDTTGSVCKLRAENSGRPGLIAVIDRMEEAWQPLGKDEHALLNT
jgi:predicted kinase